MHFQTVNIYHTIIYDPTVGSSTTPRSGHLQPHGRVVTVYLCSKFTPLLPFVKTTELPFVIIRYNYPQLYANNYLTLLTTSNVFPATVPTYVIQGQLIARHYCSCKYYVAITILTGNTMHQGIDGYFCDTVVYSEI